MKLHEDTILELENRVNTEYQRDIAAIKRVLRLIRKNKLLAQSAAKTRANTISGNTESQIHRPESSVAPNGSRTRRQLENDILATIEKFPGRFTFAELVQAVKVSFPTQQIDRRMISSVIFQSKGKRIRVVQEGWGRKKAIYEKM